MTDKILMFGAGIGYYWIKHNHINKWTIARYEGPHLIFEIGYEEPLSIFDIEEAVLISNRDEPRKK